MRLNHTYYMEIVEENFSTQEIILLAQKVSIISYDIVLQLILITTSFAKEQYMSQFGPKIYSF